MEQVFNMLSYLKYKLWQITHTKLWKNYKMWALAFGLSAVIVRFQYPLYDAASWALFGMMIAMIIIWDYSSGDWRHWQREQLKERAKNEQP